MVDVPRVAATPRLWPTAVAIPVVGWTSMFMSGLALVAPNSEISLTAVVADVACWVADCTVVVTRAATPVAIPAVAADCCVVATEAVAAVD